MEQWNNGTGTLEQQNYGTMEQWNWNNGTMQQ